MNIKKTKLALALTGTLVLFLPMSQAFAHEQHCGIKETQLGDTMKYMKNELRAYVKGFKSGEQDKMQKHLNELLKLSEQASQYTPVLISNMHHAKMDMNEIDHSKMDMKEMDHSKMDMKEMDHSKMDMKEVDSADHDMSSMPSMEGMSAEQHNQHMKYMKGIEQLHELFKALNQTQDEAEIKAILGKIKEHSKKSHQAFRQDC